jgi:hypothetical protein
VFRQERFFAFARRREIFGAKPLRMTPIRLSAHALGSLFRSRRKGKFMKSRTLTSMSGQTKLALGAVLASFGALGIVLSLLLGWTEAPGPWDFLLGFITGVVIGLGATLSMAGLIERGRSERLDQRL